MRRKSDRHGSRRFLVPASAFDETIPQILTVSQVTRELRNLLEETYPQVWIEGEISNLRVVQSGHAYFTLKDADAQNVFQQLVPAVARGLQKNSASQDGLGALMGALSGGGHQRYLENPQALTESAGIADGNAILGHIFGSKDVSRNVAANASSRTGIDASIIKQMLPMVAAAAMGALSKQAGGGTAARPDSGSALSMLNTFLDADRDGSAVDDVLNLAKKLF